jgi:hypothetical protein
MEGEKGRDLAKWLQVRKDLVWLLAEAKATKQQIVEKARQRSSSTKVAPNKQEALALTRSQ